MNPRTTTTTSAARTTKRFRYAPPLDPGGHRSGAFWCELCDHGYSAVEEQDLAEHDRVHERLLKITAVYGWLIPRRVRLEIEEDSARVLRSDAPLECRVLAAEEVLRAHHDLLLRGIAKIGKRADSRLCSFAEFAAAAEIETLFPNEVACALRRAYGRVRRPEIAMKKWRYQ